MESITLIKCDDGKTIWVTSDDNQIGTESTFKNIIDPGEQFMIALAEFLGYEPANILCFDDQ